MSSPWPSACRRAISSCSGCQFPGYVDEYPGGGGQPNRVDLFLVAASVDDDAGWTTYAAVAASEEQVDRVGNDVAEVEQGERALVHAEACQVHRNSTSEVDQAWL